MSVRLTETIPLGFDKPKHDDTLYCEGETIAGIINKKVQAYRFDKYGIVSQYTPTPSELELYAEQFNAVKRM